MLGPQSLFFLKCLKLREEKKPLYASSAADSSRARPQEDFCHFQPALGAIALKHRTKRALPLYCIKLFKHKLKHELCLTFEWDGGGGGLPGCKSVSKFTKKRVNRWVSLCVRKVGALRKDIEYCVCGSWTRTKNISFLPSQTFIWIHSECQLPSKPDGHGKYKNTIQKLMAPTKANMSILKKLFFSMMQIQPVN